MLEFIFFLYSRPVLSRGQTIEGEIGDCHSCCSQCSDELVTVLEMVSTSKVRPDREDDDRSNIYDSIVMFPPRGNTDRQIKTTVFLEQI